MMLAPPAGPRPGSRGRVLAAMSGGVDSSVAALVLKEAGYEVIGVTMAIWPERSASENHNSDGCCGVGAADDARAVARRLGIPHYTLDLREPFEENVIRDFEREYANGRTPNPCVECNRTIKFDALVEKADELGCEYLATGHYARTLPLPGRDAGVGLYTGLDPLKDQSYVLYPVAKPVLDRVLFPLGSYRKPEVRDRAREAGLSVWNHPDSVELCFVGRSYQEFLAQARPDVVHEGEIRDTSGRVIGTHRGVAFFTIGQRRNLGLAGGTGDALYVVDLDAVENVVVVGPREEAQALSLTADLMNWLGPVPSAGSEVTVRVRAHGPLTGARVVGAASDSVTVELDGPVFAPAPGQGLVLYDGERVIGGGRLEKPRRTMGQAASRRHTARGEGAQAPGSSV